MHQPPTRSGGAGLDPSGCAPPRHTAEAGTLYLSLVLRQQGGLTWRGLIATVIFMEGSIVLPKLIQGGMGVAISDWRLAKAVSQLGQLGVVAGTALNVVLAGRLMDGDLGGHMRRALGSLALSETGRAILQRYYVPGGKAPNEPYRSPPAYTIRPPRFLDQLTAAATYVEVFLAREGPTRASWASTCWKRCGCPPWPRSTGPCWRGWTMC
jgi:hypothetical protein